MNHPQHAPSSWIKKKNWFQKYRRNLPGQILFLEHRLDQPQFAQRRTALPAEQQPPWVVREADPLRGLGGRQAVGEGSEVGVREALREAQSHPAGVHQREIVPWMWQDIRGKEDGGIAAPPHLMVFQSITF